MTDNELEQLRYPIGRYEKPAAFDAAQLPEWLGVLRALPSWMDACIENLDEQQLHTPYRPGGWTIQQVVHHVADSHLNAYIRLKLALTEDNPTVAPYDENAWATLPDVEAVPVNVSVTMLHTIHRRLVAVLERLSPADMERTYFHPQHQRTFPIWELIALYVWHSRHHTGHIQQLRDRMGWW
ncbi:bacillithiol transferase BstA [Nemorincola caseinilytica]|uniref:Bacillithiol transferase BstA n=1 Tax=Nemorincola caseinilytica TaxID=2054315 RepID=A0ABP8N6P0_9BACT